MGKPVTSIFFWCPTRLPAFMYPDHRSEVEQHPYYGCVHLLYDGIRGKSPNIMPVMPT